MQGTRVSLFQALVVPVRVPGTGTGMEPNTREKSLFFSTTSTILSIIKFTTNFSSIL